MSNDQNITFHEDLETYFKGDYDLSKTYTTHDLSATELELFVHMKKECRDLTVSQFVREQRIDKPR
jgi:hypothetical protein